MERVNDSHSTSIFSFLAFGLDIEIANGFGHIPSIINYRRTWSTGAVQPGRKPSRTRRLIKIYLRTPKTKTPAGTILYSVCESRLKAIGFGEVHTTIFLTGDTS